jgi:hypothetical protein
MTERLLRGLDLDVRVLELILQLEVFLTQGLDLLQSCSQLVFQPLILNL